MSLVGIFALLALLTLSSTLIALPAGSYSDHHERRRVLAFSWLVFAASFIGFAASENIYSLIPLFIIYGIYYGATQGIAKAIISDFVPFSKQGLAFGLYSMTIGLALLPASIIAGYLWQNYNSSTAFYFGATLSLIAAFILFYIVPHPKTNKSRWDR